MYRPKLSAIFIELRPEEKKNLKTSIEIAVDFSMTYTTSKYDRALQRVKKHQIKIRFHISYLVLVRIVYPYDTKPLFSIESDSLQRNQLHILCMPVFKRNGLC